MKRRWTPLPCLMVLAGTGVALGSEIFVVRFNTSPVLVEPCKLLYYLDELVFYNSTHDFATVRLLDVSNGGTVQSPQDLVLAPLAAASSFSSDAVASWTPEDNPRLWVAHLDVPDGVQLRSRLLVGTPPPLSCAPPRVAVFFRKYPGGPMPSVSALTPVGVPQIHLGTDLGADDLGRTADARTNIGIYNGGTMIAHATIEVRRVCDRELIASTTAVIGRRSVTQVNGLPAGGDGCPNFFANFEHYVIVTVDQPSFSYAVTLSNEDLPLAFVGTSP